MTDWIQQFVSPHYTWLRQEVLPPALELWHRLDVPPWAIYRTAVHDCAADFVQSSQSTYQVLHLTLKPIVILLWVVLQCFSGVVQVFFRLLLEKGWISLQKGALQAKAASIWCYHFQRSLSRTEVLGELGIVATLVLCYYLRKWFQRQTYWARAMKKFKQKKRKLIQSYTKAVHQVAQVSFLLAMTLPHLCFLGGGLAFKLLFPSVVKWLAYDTYTTVLLSVWYPLVCTLSWIHDRRHGRGDDSKTKNDASTSSISSPSVKELAGSFDTKAPTKSKAGTTRRATKKQPSYMKATSASKERTAATPESKRKARSVFAKTHPSPKAAATAKSTSPTQNPPASPARSLAGPDPEASTKYWVQYWGIYALVQCLGHSCSMVPVFGRFVARHPFMLSMCAELKLLFFIWLFAMEKLLGNTAEDAFLAEAMPLRLLHRHVTPILLEFETVVSEVVSKETWKSVVYSKAQRVLDVFVMLRMLSEKNKDSLLHVLEESRTLILPSLSLLMPGFVTQFGVAYVQFLVPAGKSAQAKSESAELLYLQYWVLHCLLSGFLTWFSSILWWVPFSTHAIFLLWCHVSFPQTISEYYSILEMELIAFGILKGDPVMTVHETRTIQLLTSITKRLPSAGDVDETNDNDEPPSELKASESTLSEASTDQHSAIDPSISIDSQRIEVSISPKVGSSPESIDEGEDETAAPFHEEKSQKQSQTAKDDEDKHDEEDSIPGLSNKTSTTHDGESCSESSGDENRNNDNDNDNLKQSLRRSTRSRRKAVR